MRGRGAAGAIAASPTMVGAVTTLIVIVAVFLAYNANAGLPFVPVYRVSIEIPDAARLTNNNEVRIGGHRVGVVESIDAIQTDEATTTAQAGEGTRGRRQHRRRRRAAQPQARQERRAAAGRLDLPRPLPLLVRSQVPGDRPRHRRGGARGLHLRRHRRRRHLRAAHRSRDLRLHLLRGGLQRLLPDRRPSSTTSPTPSTSRRGPRRASTSRASATRFAGRGTSLNDAITASSRCSRASSPWPRS